MRGAKDGGSYRKRIAPDFHFYEGWVLFVLLMNLEKNIPYNITKKVIRSLAMNIDEMLDALEKYLEEAGFENVKEKYLKNKSDEEIKVLYEVALNDLDR